MVAFQMKLPPQEDYTGAEFAGYSYVTFGEGVWFSFKFSSVSVTRTIKS